MLVQSLFKKLSQLNMETLKKHYRKELRWLKGMHSLRASKWLPMVLFTLIFLLIILCGMNDREEFDLCYANDSL